MEQFPKTTKVEKTKDVETLTGAPDYKGGVTEEKANEISNDWASSGGVAGPDVAGLTREIEAKMDVGVKESNESSGSDLPEITAEIKRLREEISQPKGGFFDRLKSKFSSGAKEDTIELLKKGGMAVAKQQDRFKMYKELIASGKKDVAIEFVLGLGQGKKITIKDGEIVNISGNQQRGGGILG